MSHRWTLSTLGALVVASAATAQVSTRPLSPEHYERFDVTGGELVSLDVPDQATNFQVEVELGDRAVTLKMWPHEVRSDAYRLLVEDDQGIREVPAGPTVTLRGRILGEPDSRVAGALWDGHFHAYVVEDVNEPEVWAIQPLDEFGPASPWHVVYHEDQIADVPGACGVPDAPGSVTLSEPRRQFAGTEPIKVCEIAFDADNQYYNLLGQSVVGVENDIANIMNNVDFIYVRDVAITYELTTILVRTSEPDPFTSSNPSTLLGQFRDHWNSQQNGIQRDIAHLFTGRDLQGNVIGVAWLGVICTNNLPYGLSQSRYTGNLALRVGLTAHELGHNWSAPHCNDSGGCAIMCSGNGGCGGPGNFGPDSTAFILNHKASRPCLSDPFPPTLASASPGIIQAYLGDTITLAGSDLGGTSAVDVNGQTYDPAFNNLNILSDDEIELFLAIAPDLGTNAITAVNLAGPSNAVSVDVVPTAPPKLGGPFNGVVGANLTYTTGGVPGDSWFLFAALDNPLTVNFLGSEILVGSSPIGLQGVLDDVGVESVSIQPTDPSLVGRSVYLHSLLLGASGFGGATNVVSTTFIQ